MSGVQIQAKWISNIGTIKENKTEGSGPWKKGNGIVEAGETFVYKGNKYTISAEDVSSYEAFDHFLEKHTSGKVDFLLNDAGGTKYLVYRHAQDGIKVVDSANGRNLFSRERIEEPDFNGFDTTFANKTLQAADACNAAAALEVTLIYRDLVKSAQVYVSEARDYQSDLGAFYENDNLNDGDVEGLLARTRSYNIIAGQYYSVKKDFYDYTPVNKCQPNEPTPPSEPIPLPSDPRVPSDPIELPNDGENNPDKNDDF